MPLLEIDETLCGGCGLCMTDCIAQIIEKNAEGYPFVQPDNEAKCFKCQHCLTVCPCGALSILGKQASASREIAQMSLPSFEQMDDLIRSRRSFRHYEKENVDAQLVDKLLKSIAHVPTGCNRQELTFHVIDNLEVMARFQERALDALIAAAGQEGYTARYPILQDVVTVPREKAAAFVFRGAPHALIVSAPADAPCPNADVILALAYFELLAQSAGLGTVWWGLFDFILKAVPELGKFAGVPEGHVCYAMLFGKPAIQFARAAQKEDAAKIIKLT